MSIIDNINILEEYIECEPFFMDKKNVYNKILQSIKYDIMTLEDRTCQYQNKIVNNNKTNYELAFYLKFSTIRSKQNLLILLDELYNNYNSLYNEKVSIDYNDLINLINSYLQFGAYCLFNKIPEGLGIKNTVLRIKYNESKK